MERMLRDGDYVPDGAGGLETAEGAEEAVTARHREERKKAMVSISKPVRPMLRRTRQ